MKPLSVEYYQGQDGLWYWHIRASNGKIIADGSEGYASRRNVRRAIFRFVATVMQRVPQVRQVGSQ